MEFEYNTLEEKFKQLPDHIQKALTSTSVTDEIKSIGRKHNLHIDQEAVLFDLTSYVMLGLLPTDKFVESLAKEAAIKTEDAKSIAEDINTDIFGKIKASIQTVEEDEPEEGTDEAAPVSGSLIQNQRDISSFEKAGGLTVEKREENEPIQLNSQGEIEKREDILGGIENPQAGSEKISRKEHDSYAEPMVDHLLRGTMAQPQQKIVSSPAPISSPTPSAVAPSTPPVAPQTKKPGSDPYLEPI